MLNQVHVRVFIQLLRLWFVMTSSLSKSENWHLFIQNVLVYLPRVCVCLSVSGDSAAQTGCSESDSDHAEGSAGVYGAGPLPAPLSHSLQSDALTSNYSPYSSYCWCLNWPNNSPYFVFTDPKFGVFFLHFVFIISNIFVYYLFIYVLCCLEDSAGSVILISWSLNALTVLFLIIKIRL